MTACLGLRLQDMAELPREIGELSWADLNTVYWSDGFVDNILKPCFLRRNTGASWVHIHSELMIISMIASPFR